MKPQYLGIQSLTAFWVTTSSSLFIPFKIRCVSRMAAYVWERFTRSCISADALRIMEESENIRKMLSHKPFYPASEEYKRFLGQIVLKIDQLNGKYPYLDFQKEREICRIRLKA